MTLFAVALVVIVVCSAVMILQRLRAGDLAATAYARELEHANDERQAQLVRVKVAVDAVADRMESWNATVATSISELPELGAQPSPPSGTDRSQPSLHSVDIERLTAPLAVPPSPGSMPGRVITSPPRVWDHHSEAEFKNTLAVQRFRTRAGPLVKIFPTEPDLPVGFMIPTLGSPGVDSSAESVVATEDHDAALAMLVALLARWPEAEVERRRISTGENDSAWTTFEGHLCTFCRERRNPLTKALLDHASTRERFDLSFPVREKDMGIRLNGKEYFARTSETSMFDSGGELLGEREDVALVARFPNPWFPGAKALVIAGTRAYGTWGAAEYLKSHWEELMARVSQVQGSAETAEQRDFACVLRVGVAYGIESEIELPATPLLRDVRTVATPGPSLTRGSIETAEAGRFAA